MGDVREVSIKYLHPLLQKLVLYQKAGYDVRHILTSIKEFFGAKHLPSINKEELLACQAATLVALRVGAELSIVARKWDENRTIYAAVVHTCLSVYENDNDILNLGLVVKFTNIHSLFSALLSNVGGPSSSILIILQAVFDLCRFFFIIQEWKSDFLAPKHVGLFGKLISVCLEILTERKNDISCRRLALTSLKAAVSACDVNNDSLCVVLPGLLSSLVNTACASNEYFDVVILCLEIFSIVVQFCLADHAQNNADVPLSMDLRPEIQQLFVQKDSDWIAETTANIVKMVRKLCSELAMHRDELVLSTLLQVVDAIRNKCQRNFEALLDPFLFDLVLTVPENVALKSDIINRLRCEKSNKFTLHLHEKLRDLTEVMPLHVQKGMGDSNVLLQQMANILRCFDEHLSLLVTSRAPILRSVLPALATSLRIDLPRLCISRGQFDGSSLELIKLLPFSFDIDIRSIFPICNALATYGGFEYYTNFHVIELALAEMVDSDKSCRASLALITTFILVETKCVGDPYVLFSLAESCIGWLTEFQPKEHARDDIIECKIPVATDDTVLTVALVSLLAITLTKITEEKKQLKLLITFLYQLLGLYGIPNWIVHDAADCALNEIASTFSLSVSEFLYERGSYMVHRIALAAHSRTEHDHAPIVLSALLDRVDNQKMYFHVRHIVEDLLQALDNFMQEYCILILRSMLSFVSAIGRWFSDLKPSEEESESGTEDLLSEEQAFVETRKKPLPLPITSVENVLSRTTHLLSSPFLPIRVLVLKVLYQGLWVLRNFDDSLLPIIHQNWEALINRFTDREFEVRQECVKVVSQMVKVSKTFVYRRVRYQMWPLVEKWMRNESMHNYSTVSSLYKYQMLLIESCADIWTGIDARPADVELPLSVLRLYCRHSINKQLKLAAEKAVRCLEIYIEEKRQQSCDELH